MTNPYHRQLAHETFQQFVSRINGGATIMDMPVQRKSAKKPKGKKKSKLHDAMAKLSPEELATLMAHYTS